MKPIRTQQRYRCGFCKFVRTKSVVETHEKRCFRNLNRFCDYCDNKGYTLETMAEDFPPQKISCPYCLIFDKEKLASIEKRESELTKNKE